MKFKLHYENRNSTQGGWVYIGLFKLMWWLFLGTIFPNPYWRTDIYFIRRIETKDGKRI